ncbi:MAG: FeoA family protein [Bdellovibrionaceae bacterium]|nr:FeoA family protein [Pseudobdellovibrionaceae bacterium]
MTYLSYLPIGQKAKICGFNTKDKTGLRFMEMGLRINETIQVLARLPFGGNLIILSKHGKYSLRHSSASQIQVNKIAH